MLEKQDLKQIKEIVNSSIEEFAHIVSDGFQEQKEYMDEKFGKIDKRFDNVEGRLDKIEQELSAIRLRLDNIEDRLGKLENKVNRMAKSESEDFIVFNGEIEKLKIEVNGFKILSPGESTC